MQIKTQILKLKPTQLYRNLNPLMKFQDSRYLKVKTASNLRSLKGPW